MMNYTLNPVPDHRMQATAGWKVFSYRVGVRPPRLMRNVRRIFKS